jgi:hypothetical protein
VHINCIKYIRYFNGLGLAEAKQMYDAMRYKGQSFVLCSAETGTEPLVYQKAPLPGTALESLFSVRDQLVGMGFKVEVFGADFDSVLKPLEALRKALQATPGADSILEQMEQELHLLRASIDLQVS